jgi:hypothetical protein
MNNRPHTADEFLRSVREARIEKRRCAFRLEELRTQAEKVTAAYGALAPGGSSDDHKDALLIAAAEQGEKLLRREQEYLRRIEAVEDFISELPDVRHRTVLRLRYIDGLRWDDVLTGLREYGMQYEPRHMYRLHGSALAEARRMWDEWVAGHPEINEGEDAST